ncbi:flagellar filament capping protein FliD [Variovorax sp. PvP013]|jgi:flagellar hook-associated protein 2|uniref:flagellar filament capping protein FliD n=1 Tax=Variovorax sp. PvP013 TaxID=3156435 RepID=UPI003D1FF997
MATISSAGIGSGLDVDGIVTKLMAVEKQPLTSLQTKASTLTSKISAFGTIKSQLSSLSDAAGALAKAAIWDGKTAATGNAAAISASLAGTPSASISSFEVSVSTLARAQTAASAAVSPPGSTVGSGNLSIALGSWSGGPTPAFTQGTAAAVSVAVTATDTMSSIATKINAAGAGVSATVIKDASGERLMMRSSTTGEAAGFRIQTTDDGTSTGPGLGVLAFDDPAGGKGMAAGKVQYGQNAKATINGIDVSSPTNTLADTVTGVSLTLSQVTTTPVQIDVTSDTSAMRTAIKTFVTAYNATNDMFNSAMKYDATTKTAALLQGDGTTRGLQNALRSMVGATSGGGAIKQLSDLGISVGKDATGNLVVDDAKLTKALADPAAVRQFFSAAAATTSATGTTGTTGTGAVGDATTGFATRFAAFTQDAIGTGGSLSGKTDSLQAQKTANGKDQDRVNTRLTLTEARLRKQYSALDTTVSSLTALNTYVTQQIAQWNKST